MAAKQLVVVGDTHLHFWKNFSSGFGRSNSRFQKTLENLRRSLEKARELNCPWLQAGDWVHTIGFTYNPVLNELADLLNQYDDVEKFTVWGNHDGRSAGGKIDFEETAVAVLSRAVKSLDVLVGYGHQWIRKTKNGLDVYGEGFQPDLNFLSFPHLQTGGDRLDVGLFHQTVAGSLMPSGIKLDSGLPREWLLKQFTLSIVGDVHQPQVLLDNVGVPFTGDTPIIRGKGPVILVPGSLEQHNFGDVGEHGWWVCSVDGENVELELIPSTSPKFVTVGTAAEVKPDGNFYRVTTPCDPSELPEGAVGVTAPPTVVEQRDAIAPGSNAQQVLETWMRLVGADHFISCPVLHGASVDCAPPMACYNGLLGVGLHLLDAEGPTNVSSVQLVSAELENFLCYSQASFKIENGITLITGVGRDYESNGAGKTTLFEAIYWGLFGRTTKGVDSNEVIQRGSTECSVKLHLGQLVILRTRKKDGTSSLEIHERDVLSTSSTRWGGTPKELTNQLQKYLGFTPELFQALTYFSQSKLVLFSQASDAERKTMLSDLCGLDVYQKASAAARTAGGKIEQEIIGISMKVAMLQQGVDETSSLLAQQKELHSAWETGAVRVREECRFEIEKTNAFIFKLDQDWHAFEEDLDVRRIRESTEIEDQKPKLVEETTAKLRGSLDTATHEYETWKSSLGPLPEEATLREKKSEFVGQLREKREKLQTIHSHLAQKQATIRSKQDTVRGLESKPDKCPTCGSSVDLSVYQLRIGQLKTEVSELEEQVPPWEEQRRELESEIRQVDTQLPGIEELISKSASRKQRESEFTTRIEQLTKTLNEQVEWLVGQEIKSALQRLEVEIKNHRAVAEKDFQGRREGAMKHLSYQEEKIKSFSINPHVFDHLEKKLTAKGQELESVQKSLEVQQDNLRMYEYWAEGFSRTGIQSLLMEEVSAAFNHIRPQVFPLLTNGIYDVQFATTSKTSLGELREKTDFIIRDRGALVSYESLSGGQRRRIDLGVMLTLALAVSHTRNVSGILGMLVLDEVFGFLDSDGVESLYQVLVEVNKTIPSIYAVTHNPNLVSLFEHTLKVYQNEYGVSSLGTDSKSTS